MTEENRCSCGSGKPYSECCFIKPSLGHKLNLKGKKAEDFVYELAKNSFLEDWCFRNPKLLNGKELCDLLIVFDDIVIIWQIKNLKLGKDGKYKESKVKKNLKQLATARFRLFDLKLPIWLENLRGRKETFNPENIKEVYLISAMLGEGEDYFEFMREVRGHTVHTFTRGFTEIVLSELDTIKDFVAYLKEKENISSLKKITLNGGEEELLAFYLMNQRSFDRISEFDFILIDKGSWDELQKRQEYLAKKEEDKISYLWDRLIDSAHECPGDYERVSRELARPSRFERRAITKAFLEAQILAHHEQKNLFRRVIEFEGRTFCFLFFDDPSLNRTKRRFLLHAICYVARGLFKNNSTVTGIATEMKIKPTYSYDFFVLNLPEWTKENQIEMERLQTEMGIFSNPQLKNVKEQECPQQK